MTRLSLDDVTVQRGELILCTNVSFELFAGEICHLIGENGLGKTTLLMQMVGLLPTLTGVIHTPSRVLYVGHQTGLHESLSVAQNLMFLLSLYGKKPSMDALVVALDAVGLAHLIDVPSAQLSAGQTRRVGLARLWLMDVDDAPLWLLDEPLTALDVAMTKGLQARMLSFVAAGGAILLSSHQPVASATRVLDLAAYA